MSRPPRYKAVVDGFAAAIRSGELPPGTRLPTHRTLAREHGIALATATRVYGELTAAGLVAGEPGRGTFVRDRSGYDGLDARRIPRGRRVADLSFNQPLAPGQGDELREALRRLAASGDIASLLGQHPVGGRATDRAAVATHLLDAGLDVPPDAVLLTAGAQHALDTAVRALARPGDVIAVDALTYPGIKLAADVHGVELAAVPHTVEGMDLDALAALAGRRRLAAVYTMPTLHNPLGTVASAAHRLALADLARRADLTLIEDGTYAFLLPGPAPLQALAPERTVHLAGLSKSVAAGLRFGHLVAPPAYVPALTRVLRASTWGLPPLVTALATGWIADGTVRGLAEDRRQDARARQEVAQRVLGGLDYRAHPAAPFGWLGLPATPGRAAGAARALAERGVLVSTSDAFAVGTSSPRPALRLALASPRSHLRLEDALRQVRATAATP
ncbi:putative GntR family transcriptional regulator [Actinacidiphila reveromycinica]|uniref:Putative GntR family transcriptional regulator n=1 Tax=Actinacidiphila reveromycinica TaxID=659352 RepID=A0A7U3VLL1_9ACTN|nr:PLP-dependent aminotransferase family protein [Streptomyces sp. SN-593]BBA95634.1 putative GntR family transcriptional regulator [Streptomyces sp. SN-593]